MSASEALQAAYAALAETIRPCCSGPWLRPSPGTKPKATRWPIAILTSARRPWARACSAASWRRWTASRGTDHVHRRWRPRRGVGRYGGKIKPAAPCSIRILPRLPLPRREGGDVPAVHRQRPMGAVDGLGRFAVRRKGGTSAFADVASPCDATSRQLSLGRRPSWMTAVHPRESGPVVAAPGRKDVAAVIVVPAMAVSRPDWNLQMLHALLLAVVAVQAPSDRGRVLLPRRCLGTGKPAGCRERYDRGRHRPLRVSSADSWRRHPGDMAVQSRTRPNPIGSMRCTSADITTRRSRGPFTTSASAQLSTGSAGRRANVGILARRAVRL